MTDESKPKSNRWVKGMASPNPRGRKPGAKGKKNQIDDLMIENGRAIVNILIAQALDGDTASAALILNRISPPLKSQNKTVNFTLDITKPVASQCNDILSAASKGEIAPDVAKELVNLVGSVLAIKQLDDFEQRLEILEQQRGAA